MRTNKALLYPYGPYLGFLSPLWEIGPEWYNWPGVLILSFSPSPPETLITNGVLVVIVLPGSGSSRGHMWLLFSGEQTVGETRPSSDPVPGSIRSQTNWSQPKGAQAGVGQQLGFSSWGGGINIWDINHSGPASHSPPWWPLLLGTSQWKYPLGGSFLPEAIWVPLSPNPNLSTSTGSVLKRFS